MNSRRHARLLREQRSHKFWKAFNRIGKQIREESDKAVIDALMYGTGAVRIDVTSSGAHEGLTAEKLIRAKRILLGELPDPWVPEVRFLEPKQIVEIVNR